MTFVKEIAIALRLPASNNVKFIRSPKEFLEDLQLRASKTNPMSRQEDLNGHSEHATAY